MRRTGSNRPVAGIVVSAMAAAVLMAATQALADPVGSVQHRQFEFKRLGGATKVVVGFLKDGVGTPADVEGAAALMVRIGDAMPGMFPEGTSVGIAKSEALPSIWANRQEFAREIAQFRAAAASLQEAASAGNKATIGARLQAVTAACMSCHTAFRQR